MKSPDRSMPWAESLRPVLSPASQNGLAPQKPDKVAECTPAPFGALCTRPYLENQDFSNRALKASGSKKRMMPD